jgi:predicted CXXCH cytochrome family protein
VLSGDRSQRVRSSWVRALRTSLGLATIVLALVALASEESEDPHGRRDRCTSCHKGAPPDALLPPSNGSSPSLVVSYPLLDEGETLTCFECHRHNKAQIHPVDIRPLIPVPQGWPLSAEGRLACSTCHDPHLPTRAAQAGPALLRANIGGEAFCRICHTHTASRDPGSVHILAVETAHRNSPLRPYGTWGALDPYSTRCLGCHDGTAATDATNDFSPQQVEVDVDKSHPIGMDYRRAAQSRRATRRLQNLRDPATLDERIRLFDGKVGCGSCHNPYAKTEMFLVIATEHGELCFSCHQG